MSLGQYGRSVSILNAAYTPLGFVTQTPEILGCSERELFAMACIEAMKDSNIDANDVDAYYVGISGPSSQAKVKSAAPFFSEWIGMRGKPTIFHDEGCGTQAFGLQLAVQAVASGQYDCVITGAVNINSSAARAGFPPFIRDKQDRDALTADLLIGDDAAYQTPGTGSAVPALEAAFIRYAIQNKLSFANMEDACTNYLLSKREEAILNPKAVLAVESYESEAKRFGFDDARAYLTSNKFNPKVGTLVRFKCSGAMVDGASAIIVCSTEKAKQLVKKPIEVAGVTTSTALDKMFGEVPNTADVKMFRDIYTMAGITDPRKEVDYMGIHDCPCTMILPVTEAAGYFDQGEAFRYMIEGRLTHESDRAVNTTGGRTQSGHPRSPAFGIEVAEAVAQMRGEAGARQLANVPKTSVVWGGGSGFNLGACVLRTL